LALDERCGADFFPTVLDFGCGTGWVSADFARKGSRVIGVEVQLEPLWRARERCGEGAVLLVLYKGNTLPIVPGSMDLVVAVGVIRSLMDRGPLSETLGEWHRCLRDGGRLTIIETDNRAFRAYMKPEALRESVVAAGFKPGAWYPIRKVSWLGLDLVKKGILPKKSYEHLAAWELRLRRRLPRFLGKHAFLGEFHKHDFRTPAEA
jgi:SAM-dependent methyltransferase